MSAERKKPRDGLSLFAVQKPTLDTELFCAECRAKINSTELDPLPDACLPLSLADWGLISYLLVYILWRHKTSLEDKNNLGIIL